MIFKHSDSKIASLVKAFFKMKRSREFCTVFKRVLEAFFSSNTERRMMMKLRVKSERKMFLPKGQVKTKAERLVWISRIGTSFSHKLMDDGSSAFTGNYSPQNLRVEAKKRSLKNTHPTTITDAGKSCSCGRNTAKYKTDRLASWCKPCPSNSAA